MIAEIRDIIAESRTSMGQDLVGVVSLAMLFCFGQVLIGLF